MVRIASPSSAPTCARTLALAARLSAARVAPPARGRWCHILVVVSASSPSLSVATDRPSPPLLRPRSYSRFAMMDHYTLGVHKVDVQIMQLNNCIQCLAVICDILAIFAKEVPVARVWARGRDRRRCDDEPPPPLTASTRPHSSRTLLMSSTASPSSFSPRPLAAWSPRSTTRSSTVSGARLRWPRLPPPRRWMLRRPLWARRWSGRRHGALVGRLGREIYVCP